MRLPAIKRSRSFRLFVGSDCTDAPPDRWFGSLDAALRGFRALDDRWKPSAWIIEYRDQPVVGGIQVVRNVVHMKHGQRIDEAAE